MIWQKINCIHNNPDNPSKAGLVSSAKDYRWSSFRTFYLNDPDPMDVDKEWWWPDDVRKLSIAAREWSEEIARERKT